MKENNEKQNKQKTKNYKMGKKYAKTSLWNRICTWHTNTGKDTQRRQPSMKYYYTPISKITNCNTTEYF